MTTRARRDTTLQSFDPEDRFGRISIPGARSLLTARRLRRINSGLARYHHRAPNGINDPFTFFHLTTALLNLEPDKPFSAAQLAGYLNEAHPTIRWDAVVVGRIMNDLAESFSMANGRAEMQPIDIHREWSGTYYQISRHELARAVLINVIEDMIALCDELQTQETLGVAPKRLATPLLRCPSVMDPLQAAA